MGCANSPPIIAAWPLLTGPRHASTTPPHSPRPSADPGFVSVACYPARWRRATAAFKSLSFPLLDSDLTPSPHFTRSAISFLPCGISIIHVLHTGPTYPTLLTPTHANRILTPHTPIPCPFAISKARKQKNCEVNWWYSPKAHVHVANAFN